jgi:hypothetical protein
VEIPDLLPNLGSGKTYPRRHARSLSFLVHPSRHSEPEKLNQLISDPNFNHNPEHARIFILEDLSRDMVEVFGAAYDIDPLFFRGHLLDYLWYNIRDPWVDLPDLEGVVQGYASLQLIVTLLPLETFNSSG